MNVLRLKDWLWQKQQKFALPLLVALEAVDVLRSQCPKFYSGECPCNTCKVLRRFDKAMKHDH